MSKAVLIIPTIFADHVEPLREAVRSFGCEIKEYHTDTGLDRSDLASVVLGARILITCLDRVSKGLLNATSSLCLVVKLGAGLDNIDLKAATCKGIPVIYTPGANAVSVAELAVGLMFALARQIPFHDKRIKRSEWGLTLGAQLHGKTLGLVGLGRIGQGVARICKAIGMRIIATDVQWPADFADSYEICQVSLDNLLSEADFVSIHVPQLSDTEGLIGFRELSLMKRTAFLVNTSRGLIVDEDALYDSLRSGTLAGAAMDTFKEEPPQATKFLLLDNFIATSHIGGSTDGAVRAVIAEAVQGLTYAIRGEKSRHVANPACWDTWLRERMRRVVRR
jgi:D-3-phosphoglycerate dehydrogenase